MMSRENQEETNYIHIQPKTIDLNTRLWEILQSLGVITQSLVLRSIVLE